MCTFHLSLNDSLVDRIRPSFEDEEAVNVWMQKQLELAILSFTASQTPRLEKKQTLSQRLRGIAHAPENFDYKQELQSRFE